MTKTILITGASSGIGRATALYFQKKGWNVAATMRSPEKELNQETNKSNSLANLDRVIVLKLDVTDPASITNAIAATIDRFGAIDVLVNNAGYGLMGDVIAKQLLFVRKLLPDFLFTKIIRQSTGV